MRLSISCISTSSWQLLIDILRVWNGWSIFSTLMTATQNHSQNLEWECMHENWKTRFHRLFSIFCGLNPNKERKVVVPASVIWWKRSLPMLPQLRCIIMQIVGLWIGEEEEAPYFCPWVLAWLLGKINK